MKINNNILSETQKNFQFSQLKTNVWLNVFVLIIFAWFYFLFLSWELQIVQQNKDALQQAYDRFTNMEKKGLTLWELTATFPEDKQDQKMLVQNGWNELYQSIFANNTTKNYLDFLKEKEAYISELKQTDFIQQRDLKISKALPIFEEKGNGDLGTLTEVEFSSYFERLFRTFWLGYDGQVSFSNMELLNPEDLKNQKNSYTPQIYFNEMTFKIDGKKWDIIDFLYFVENVWNISIVNNDGNEDVAFHTDNVIQKQFFSAYRGWTKNIYENMMMEIVNLKMSDSFDSSDSANAISNIWKPSIAYLTYLKSSNNLSEEFGVEVTFRFYVRGIPLYKKESDIKNVLDRYTKLNSDIKSLLQKSKNRSLQKSNIKMIEVVNTLTSLDLYMTNLDTKIKSIRVWINQKANIEWLYKEAYSINKDLDIINKNYLEAKNITEQTQNIKK